MTNEELLQQELQKAADKIGYENFDDMYEDMIHIGSPDELRKEIENAALQAIQSAREEAYTAGKSAGVASMKHEQEVFKGEIKRLTSQKEMLQKSVKYWRDKHDHGDNSMS